MVVWFLLIERAPREAHPILLYHVEDANRVRSMVTGNYAPCQVDEDLIRMGRALLDLPAQELGVSSSRMGIPMLSEQRTAWGRRSGGAGVWLLFYIMFLDGIPSKRPGCLSSTVRKTSWSGLYYEQSVWNNSGNHYPSVDQLFGSP
jgi:hypothetical protein